MDVDTDLAFVCRASIYVVERAWQASLPKFIIRLTSIYFQLHLGVYSYIA
jgi:hypothetical protein